MKPLVLALTLLAPTPAATAALPRMMVVASNPLAAAAGLQMLKSGGTAADAAIATLAVLGLVDPQDAGIGGGGIALAYDARSRQIAAFDGREAATAATIHPVGAVASAPGGAANSASGGAATGASGGAATGVPGALAMLELLYRTRGHLPWATLFQPAIRLATEGFPVGPALARAIATDAAWFAQHPAARAIFAPHGPPRPGAVLKNPDYAETLRRIAANGSAAMMHGPAAADIASAVRADPNPGLMTADDLAAYQPRKQDAICAPFAHVTVCTAGRPSWGGTFVLQTLGMLGHVDIPQQNPGTALMLLDAERLAAADRDAYAGDTDVPAPGLLDGTYLATRAALLNPGHALRAAPAGLFPSVNPGAFPAAAASPPAPLPDHDCSAIAIVDSKGNAVSLTACLGGNFGSHVMTHGFFLNHALLDFSPASVNAAAPGGRPRTAMAPVLVVDAGGRLLAVLAVAGGARMPGFLALDLLGAFAWHQTAAQSLAAPRILATGTTQQLENIPSFATLLAVLRSRGELVETTPIASAGGMILVTPKGLQGATDPRREGQVAAE